MPRHPPPPRRPPHRARILRLLAAAAACPRAATLAPSPDAHPAQTALRDRRSSDRASGRCSAPPSRALRRCRRAPLRRLFPVVWCAVRARAAHTAAAPHPPTHPVAPPPPPRRPRRRRPRCSVWRGATGDGKNASPAPGPCKFFLRAPSLLIIIQTDGHLLWPHDTHTHTAPHPAPAPPPASPELEGDGKMEQPKGEANENNLFFNVRLFMDSVDLPRAEAQYMLNPRSNRCVYTRI